MTGEERKEASRAGGSHATFIVVHHYESGMGERWTEGGEEWKRRDEMWKEERVGWISDGWKENAGVKCGRKRRVGWIERSRRGC